MEKEGEEELWHQFEINKGEEERVTRLDKGDANSASGNLSSG